VKRVRSLKDEIALLVVGSLRQPLFSLRSVCGSTLPLNRPTKLPRLRTSTAIVLSTTSCAECSSRKVRSYMSQGGVLKRLTLLQKFCLKGNFLLIALTATLSRRSQRSDRSRLMRSLPKAAAHRGFAEL